MRWYVLTLFAIFFSSCYNNVPQIKTGFEGKEMPSFNLLLMDSAKTFNTAKIKKDKPIVLFYFSPLCPYCRAQTEDLIQNIKSLSRLRLIMISNFPIDKIKEYYEYYNLVKYKNITVGQDAITYFGNFYNTRSVPYIAIYNKNKQLKRVLLGKVKTSLIKDIALE